MSITHQILGEPGRDNCLFVRVDTGQSLNRLLFDCGAACLDRLPLAEIQAIDHVFFSHLHMDHVAGFDAFFRPNYNRTSKANELWGPRNTAAILQHRMQGYWWNLHDRQDSRWRVREIEEEAIRVFGYELNEAFAVCHQESQQSREHFILDCADYTVDAIQLEHKGPSLGYLVREKPRRNIDVTRLAALNLNPGPWLAQVKGEGDDDSLLEIQGDRHRIGDLRREIMTIQDGASLAYLTDFSLGEADHARTVEWLRGCDVLVCEAQYRHDDLELANKNYHMTTRQVGRLARDADVGELVLFHLSDRYRTPEWKAMRAEAAEEFPNTRFAPDWSLD